MRLAYFRLSVFYRSLSRFQRRQRELRMQAFLRIMPVSKATRILDLGGSQTIWESVDHPLTVTLLNLPGGQPEPSSSRHAFTHVVGDACAVRLEPAFDLVFSNSVIEHVGDDAKQAAFAREVRRMGRSYWIQTPSIWFPVEAHSGMPGWWFYPEAVRRFFLRRWRGLLPDWTDYIEHTRVLTRSRLQALFPEANVYVERFFGIPKSYSVWHIDGV